MTTILMKQISKFGWQIESKDGKIIQSHIYVNNIREANDYAKTYVSSFTNWNYELVPTETATTNRTETTNDENKKRSDF